jgi:hypothetical protein
MGAGLLVNHGRLALPVIHDFHDDDDKGPPGCVPCSLLCSVLLDP